jgi:hypothetical protein
MRVSGQTVGAALVAIVFGAFGASAAAGAATRDVVAHAAPAVLWIACGCAAVATLVSALRLRGLRAGAPDPGSRDRGPSL